MHEIKDHVFVGVPFQSSPNSGGGITPKIIVLDFTKSRTMMGTVRWMTGAESQSSCHIVIGRDGKCVQMVPFNAKAWHCGESIYNGRRKCNEFAISIELCNWGQIFAKNGLYQTNAKTCVNDCDVVRLHHKLLGNAMSYWESYSDEQIRVCIDLCSALKVKYNIEAIVEQSEIATPYGRCLGPGPAFDLDRVRRESGVLDEYSSSDGGSNFYELMALRNDAESIVKRIDRILDRRYD